MPKEPGSSRKREPMAVRQQACPAAHGLRLTIPNDQTPRRTKLEWHPVLKHVPLVFLFSLITLRVHDFACISVPSRRPGKT